MTFSIVTVVGARPQFIKAAALSAAFTKSDRSTERLLHTGQHFDDKMSSIFFDQLGIEPPRWNLAMGGGNHGAMTGRMLEGIEKILLENTPDMVLVFGDTNSTLAGALAAAKLRIPVAHIEAGLRSFNFYQPEEINRVLTDRVSELLFCPTQLSADYLQRENIRGKVEVVGDIMHDSVLLARKINAKLSTPLDDLELQSKGYALMTLHRAENVDEPVRLAAMIDYIRSQAAGQPVIFPVHPRTRQRLAEFKISLDGFRCIEPVGYLDMIALLEHASELYTDSGGLQKEALFCETRCVTLRDETEWPETIETGWNRLWTATHHEPLSREPVFGDGTTAHKIVASVETYLDTRSGLL
ncbi:UDP-N-acetylglucosamine 2-epimerase (non-hydrolyzing) [Hoeflea sp. YIM 152468]|uniref:non-hydrolyzing UDP-N-acetylglucosamine 2-epimerase n=1 Tax=Hoeflea sp. YIM 152468 TaxID=3031759 RepID=UPI0023DACF84|nr:UDP-N-acetylglucosamine 2-epimerase (non-hydrolyzing) [Hoeflea sp. YIM 152468]MDF1610269.1 UDP-N-acetylglucosamine 2-epimerase (non-hydrolyzing) [Hoeflea sp. YIM 152468]